jgi:hypothetical protein
MITTTCTFAPAGVLGMGSADARPYPGVAVRLPAVAPTWTVQGTGVPIARLRDDMTDTPRGEFLAQRFVAKHTSVNGNAQNDGVQFDGTTLGFHTSSRPLS